MLKRKLRIGLLLDEMVIVAWQYRMIESVRDSDYAEIVLVVQIDEPPGIARASPAEPVTKNAGWQELGNGLIRRVLMAFERLLVGRPGSLPNASRRIDATKLLSGVEVIKARATRGQCSDNIEDAELATIRARDLDVVIQLGDRLLYGGILRSARHGVWSYHHGESAGNVEVPATYWNVMKSLPETTSVLRVLDDDPDGGRVLCRSYSSTDTMSILDNDSQIKWKSLQFVPRKLKELHDDGDDTFRARVNEGNVLPRFRDGQRLRVPTNRERSVLIWRKLLQKCRRKWDHTFYVNQWTLLYDIHQDMSTSLWRFKRIVPPKDWSWADPFVVARDGKYYIFIEEVPHATQRGHISVIEMSKDGGWGAPVRVLDAPYHLSYPFVFEYENETYMIPESSDNRTVELYKCKTFPFEWEFKKNLMEDCWMVDTTLVEWQGRWWMFANRVEIEGASFWDELFLYHSDGPLSNEWTPHPRNPIVSDARSARPAGRLFARNGRLYRPSQNCSRHYGYGLNICEIARLTTTEYEERVVATVEPNWDKNIVSIHTINHQDDLTIVDGQLRRRR